jgi:SAM-dependent methyltransferase
MEAEYSTYYRELYRRHWWWRAREDAVIDVLRTYQLPGGFGKILDIGCGDGLLFDRLRDFGEVEGIEPDPLTIAEDSPHRSRIHVCHFDDSFQSAKKYGLILMLDVLEHLQDPAAAVRKVEGFLAPKGFFLATVPAFQLLWTGHDVINHHFRRYRKEALAALVRDAGLQVCAEKYWFHWLFPAKLASRVLEYGFRVRPRNPSIPPRVLNRLLYLFSRLEYRTFHAMAVPFGSSAMVLAHKNAAATHLRPVPIA